MKKAQLSLEFILSVGFILIFGILIMLYGFEKQKDARLSQSYLDLKEECTKISNTVFSAFILGDGAQFSLKTRYNTTLLYKTVKVSEGKEDFTCISQINIPDKVKKSAGQQLVIKNENGGIIAG